MVSTNSTTSIDSSATPTPNKVQILRSFTLHHLIIETYLTVEQIRAIKAIDAVYDVKSSIFVATVRVFDWAHRPLETIIAEIDAIVNGGA